MSSELSELQINRRSWMSVLSKAKPRDVGEAWGELENKPSYDFLKKPEQGLVMVRARAGGNGDRFNFGEMTVTRCAVQIDTGEVGFGYVKGRDKQHAEIAAVCDALMQNSGRNGDVQRSVIDVLAGKHSREKIDRSRKAASTKVEFFTMVRGENEK